MTAVTDRLKVLTDFCATNAEHITDDQVVTVALYRNDAKVQMSARGNAAAAVAWAADALHDPAIRISVSGTVRHLDITGTWQGLRINVGTITSDTNDALRIDLHINWTVDNVRGEGVTAEKLREIAAEVIAP